MQQIAKDILLNKELRSGEAAAERARSEEQFNPWAVEQSAARGAR